MSGAYGVWGRNSELHTSPEISWSLCDGCQRLACREDAKSRLNPWRYYCEAGACNLTRKQIYEMTEGKCPIGRKKDRRRS